VYRPGYPYEKAGVTLTHLVSADRLTARLYGDERFERARWVAMAMDEINRRHGRDTIRFGAAGREAGDEVPPALASYPTRPAEVPRVA
jgi:DNA polymerase V